MVHAVQAEPGSLTITGEESALAVECGYATECEVRRG